MKWEVRSINYQVRNTKYEVDDRQGQSSTVKGQK